MGKTSINLSETRISTSIPATADSAIAIAIKSTRGPIDRVCTVTSLEQLKKIYGESDSSDTTYSFEKAKYLVQRGNTIQGFKMESGGVKATTTVTLRAASGEGAEAVTATTLTLVAVGPGTGYNGLKVECTGYSGNMFSLVFRDAQNVLLERHNILSLDPASEYFVSNLLADSVVANVSAISGTEFEKGPKDTATFSGGTAPSAVVDYSVLKSREIPFCALITEDLTASASAGGITLRALLELRKDFVIIISGTNATPGGTFLNDELDSYLVRIAPKVTVPGLLTKDSSIPVAEVIASLHRRNLIFKSPGGIENGILKDVLKVEERLNDTEVATLQEAGVNPIVVKTGYGITLWGNYTSCITPAGIQDLATRLLANYIKRAAFRISQRFIFQEHTEYTWNQWKGAIEPVIRDIYAVGGINNYAVICDRTIMSDEDIANGILRGHITIYPVGHIQQIDISLFIDESGVTFE